MINHFLARLYYVLLFSEPYLLTLAKTDYPSIYARVFTEVQKPFNFTNGPIKTLKKSITNIELEL